MTNFQRIVHLWLPRRYGEASGGELRAGMSAVEVPGGKCRRAHLVPESDRLAGRGGLADCQAHLDTGAKVVGAQGKNLRVPTPNSNLLMQGMTVVYHEACMTVAG